MVKHEFYQEMDSNRVVMSLGFKKWCFLSIEAEFEEVNGQATLELSDFEPI